MEFIKPLEISVLSYIANLNISLTSVDILLLATFLEIDETILGVELNYLRGVKIIRKGLQFKNKNNFYNQLTLYINFTFKEKNIQRKVKIFIGGKIHVCGCQNEEEIKIIFSILKNIFSKVNVDKKIDLFPLGQLIIDSDDFIYTPDDNKVIGIVNSNGQVYINGELVSPIEDVINNKRYELWLANKLVNGKRNIYDNSGNLIGFEIKKNRKREYNGAPFIFNGDIKERLIYNLDDKVKNMQLNDLEVILLNSYYQIKAFIDKQKLKEYLQNLNYHVSYEPLIYHALKIMYYFGENSDNGKCNCFKLIKTDDNKDKLKKEYPKCTCIKTTSIVSSNGSVLLYGFRSLEQRNHVFDWLNNHIKDLGFLQ